MSDDIPNKRINRKYMHGPIITSIISTVIILTHITTPIDNDAKGKDVPETVTSVSTTVESTVFTTTTQNSQTTTPEETTTTIPETTTEETTTIITTTTPQVILPKGEELPCIYDCKLDENLQRYIYNNCVKYNIPYYLIMSIIKAESGYNVNVRSGTNVGLMQINAKYNIPLANKLGVDLYDPYGNTLVGITIVSGLLSKYSMTDALICYNKGEYGAKPYLGGSTYYSEHVMGYYNDYISRIN